jgi:hypothetical protein
MAHDIRATHTAGRTLTAKLFTAGAQVGSLIALTETAQAGYYTGSVPDGTAAGIYDVLLLEGSTLLDSRPLRWDGIEEELIVIPGPPADTGLCRVYAYLEGINNDKRLPTARIEFRLIAPDGTKAVASERLIAERVTTLKVDGLGRLQGEDGQPWADFQRNDMLTPAGTTYEVTSAALGISRKVVTLNTSIADLRALLLA